MRIVENSLINKVVDSLGVIHYNCNVYTKSRGILSNVWLIECNNELSIQSLLNDGESFYCALNEYLQKHNLTTKECQHA